MHRHEPTAINYLISLKYNWISQYHLQRFRCRKCGVLLQIQEKEQHRANVATQLIYMVTITLFFLASYISRLAIAPFSVIISVACCCLIFVASLWLISIFICKKATFISIDQKETANPNKICK